MRQQPISGYLLHMRAYRETSRLVDFFSQEHGIVRGVLRGASAKNASKGKTAPRQFQHYQAYADGKGDLKRISKLEPSIFMPQLYGQALYAGMYANELLIKLLGTEDVMHHSYFAYQDLLVTLAKISVENASDSLNQIKLALRQLEYNLLGELGYGVNFECDNKGQAFEAGLIYHYAHGEGFSVNSQGRISGAWLCQFDATNIQINDTKHLGQIFRQSIDELLDYKPLKSRELWASLYARK